VAAAGKLSATHEREGFASVLRDAHAAEKEHPRQVRCRGRVLFGNRKRKVCGSVGVKARLHEAISFFEHILRLRAKVLRTKNM
jgi:hypothetical protein